MTSILNLELFMIVNNDVICQGFDLVPRVLETEFKKLSLVESIAPQPPNLFCLSLPS